MTLPYSTIRKFLTRLRRRIVPTHETVNLSRLLDLASHEEAYHLDEAKRCAWQRQVHLRAAAEAHRRRRQLERQIPTGEAAP